MNSWKGVVHMMMPMGSYVRRGKRLLRKATTQPKLRSWAGKLGYFLGGFLLSAASLGNQPQPLPLAALCAGITGVPGVLTALGGCLGYWIFWDGAGGQGGDDGTDEGLPVFGLIPRRAIKGKAFTIIRRRPL